MIQSLHKKVSIVSSTKAKEARMRGIILWHRWVESWMAPADEYGWRGLWPLSLVTAIIKSREREGECVCVYGAEKETAKAPWDKVTCRIWTDSYAGGSANLGQKNKGKISCVCNHRRVGGSPLWRYRCVLESENGKSKASWFSTFGALKKYYLNESFIMLFSFN